MGSLNYTKKNLMIQSNILFFFCGFYAIVTTLDSQKRLFFYCKTIIFFCCVVVIPSIRSWKILISKKSVFNIDVPDIKSVRQELIMQKMIVKFMKNKLCLKKRQKLGKNIKSKQARLNLNWMIWNEIINWKEKSK